MILAAISRQRVGPNWWARWRRPGRDQVALKNPVGMGLLPTTLPQSCVADARAWLTEQLG